MPVTSGGSDRFCEEKPSQIAYTTADTVGHGPPNAEHFTVTWGGMPRPPISGPLGTGNMDPPRGEKVVPLIYFVPKFGDENKQNSYN